MERFTSSPDKKKKEELIFDKGLHPSMTTRLSYGRQPNMPRVCRDYPINPKKEGIRDAADVRRVLSVTKRLVHNESGGRKRY